MAAVDIIPNLTNHAPTVAGTSAEGGSPRAPPLSGIWSGRAQCTPAPSTAGSGGSARSCRGDRSNRCRRGHGRGRTAAGSARSCGPRPRGGCELCSGSASWGASRGYRSIPFMTLRSPRAGTILVCSTSFRSVLSLCFMCYVDSTQCVSLSAVTTQHTCAPGSHSHSTHVSLEAQRVSAVFCD